MSRTKTSSARLPPPLELSTFLLEPTAPLDWHRVFGNDNPVEVEVGCGKGLFLISAATQFPKRNFFGIELAAKFAQFTAAQLAKHSLTNARVARADARRVATERIADSSVAALHVYFPDPWWKRRHKKRRIFTDSFLTQVVRVLKPGGELRLATDVPDYFDEISRRIAAQSGLIPAPFQPDQPQQQDTDYLTNFERKYLKAGKSVFRACFIKG